MFILTYLLINLKHIRYQQQCVKSFSRQLTSGETSVCGTMRVLFLISALFYVGGALVSNDNHHYVPLPNKELGFYILLADDTVPGKESESDEWTPALYPWQQESANVLYFSMIHPTKMIVPPAYQKLAATRGTNTNGSVPADTVILFAIGGYGYSQDPNPWPFLTSQAAAEEMAEKVAEWPKLYGCDGIDLDIEEGAGDHKEAGVNMVHFVKRIRELNPNMIVKQPVYGYPQITAETYVVNHSWDENSTYLGVANGVGLMVYVGTEALRYVKNYAQGSKMWDGFPIKVNVPMGSIILGCKGSASGHDITTLATEAVKQDLGGMMVWYSSVINGFQYSISWDTVESPKSIEGFKQAIKILNS